MDLPTITRLERPADEDALRRASRGATTALLGGGTWLFSVPQPHLDTLVDLTALRWPALTVTDTGLTIAATATLAQLAAFDPPAAWPAAVLLRELPDALVGAHAVQAQATVGGNIALALPAGPMTTLAAALDADVVVWDPDGREERRPVSDIVVGAGRTTLASGDLVRALELPGHALRARAAVRKAARSARGRSAALLAGRRGEDGGFVLAVTAALDRPAVLRFPAPPAPHELDAAVDALGDGPARWLDDPHGTPDWRRALARHLALQILTELTP